MPGPGHRYSVKEDRMASHIKASVRKRKPEISKEALGRIVYGHLENVKKKRGKK